MSNHFYASLDPNASPVAGIHFYYSDGFLSCNDATNFYDGFLLDNSIPYLYNNELFNNGIGLYITNGAIPIMAPCYSPTQTFNAGRNKIYNNITDEIYCDNTLPYLYQGKNSIYDSTGGCLISFNNFSPPYDTLLAQGNFWGDVPESQMFCPPEYVDYNEYLEYPLNTTSCSPDIAYEDNDSLSQEILLFGSANINEYLKNYSSATNEYIQVINTYNSNLLNHLVSSKIFFTNLKANNNFSGISSYFYNLANQHSGDTLFFKQLINLMIASHIEEPLYQQAIEEYQNIINNSQSQNEIYYSTLEKTRTIGLMLDTLLNPGGDNNGMNNFSFKGISSLLKNLFLNDFSIVNQKRATQNNDRNELNDRKINESKLNLTKNITTKKNNTGDKETNIQNKNNSIKTSNKNTKQNSINKIKQNVNLENINFEKLKNPDLLNFLDKIITIKLMEKSLLNYTPDIRPLVRISPSMSHILMKENKIILPLEYKLSQNYPNPFNPNTKINYELPKDGMVKLVIYDILGREIKTLVNELKQAGRYTVEFNGNNMASGIYFYRIQAGNFVQVKKMVLLK